MVKESCVLVVTPTYLIVSDCRHSELGRIVLELVQLVRCERSRWRADVQNSSSVQFSSCDANAA